MVKTVKIVEFFDYLKQKGDLWFESAIQKYLRSEALTPDEADVVSDCIGLCNLEGMSNIEWMKRVLSALQRHMIFIRLSLKLDPKGLEKIEEYRMCRVNRKQNNSLLKPITFFRSTGVWLLEGILLEESKQELMVFLEKVEKYCPYSLEDYLKGLDYYITECFIPSPTVSLGMRRQLIYPSLEAPLEKIKEGKYHE